MGHGIRPAGRIRMCACACAGGRGGSGEIGRKGLHDHRFGVGLGLGDACRGFGRRARARRRVGLGGGGRAGWGAGFGRRQRAGAAGYRRARHGWAERGGRRGCCRRRAGVGYLGVAAQVDAALASGLVDLHCQLCSIVFHRGYIRLCCDGFNPIQGQVTNLSFTLRIGAKVSPRNQILRKISGIHPYCFTIGIIT